jgi:putative membrane protein
MRVREIRATDALANERTYLAYVRTALAFIAFGFVIARFSLFAREMSLVAHVAVPSAHVSTLFGGVIAALGIAIGVYGGYRYAATERSLLAGRVASMPSYTAFAVSLLVAIIGLIVAFELVRVQ